jgi:hypothetical protein
MASGPNIISLPEREKEDLQSLFIPYTLTGLHNLQLKNGTYFPNVGIVYGLELFVRKISTLIPSNPGSQKLSCSCNSSVNEAMEMAETC